MKKIIAFFSLIVFFFISCSGFDSKLAETDFKKKYPECKIIEVVSEECQDGSILSCYLVKINYTQGGDSIKSVMCQYVKGDDGWHLVE